MITSTRVVRALATPANLRSPVLVLRSISKRDWKLLETPVTQRKHRRGTSSNRDKIAPLRSQFLAGCAGRRSRFQEELQIMPEPSQRPRDDVPRMLRVREHVALVRVDHKLGRRSIRLERVPELERLRRRTFAISLADHNECRRLGFLDKRDRRTLGVDSGIV